VQGCAKRKKITVTEDSHEWY